MQITSPELNNNENIPVKFTAQGSDINPELNFLEVPQEAKSLVLIMDDPDAPAGTWIHWILFNISPTTTKVEENSEVGEKGVNSWNNNNYGGPNPPSGKHRYFFKLYALDITLELSNPTKEELENNMEGHILAKAELIGLYERK